MCRTTGARRVALLLIFVAKGALAQSGTAGGSPAIAAAEPADIDTVVVTGDGDRSYAVEDSAAATGLPLNTSRRVLGLSSRDWCNVLTGRYISPLDPLLTRGKPYHLLQRAPSRRRPLPPDPA